MQANVWFYILEHIIFQSFDSCIELADENQLLHTDVDSNKMCLQKIMNYFLPSSDLSPPALLPPHPP